MSILSRTMKSTLPASGLYLINSKAQTDIYNSCYDKQVLCAVVPAVRMNRCWHALFINSSVPYSEGRVHLHPSEKRPAAPHNVLSAQQGLDLLGVDMQQLLFAVYCQGLQLSVFFHFHPFLAILENSLGGDVFAMNDFGGRRHGFEVTRPTATTRHGERRKAPRPQGSKGIKSCIKRRKTTPTCWKFMEGGEKGCRPSASASPGDPPTPENVLKRASEEVKRKWVLATKKLPEDLGWVAEVEDIFEGVFERPSTASAVVLHSRLAVSVINVPCLGV